MSTISAQEAGEGLDALIDQVVASHEPLLITGMERNAVLISEEVWRGIQETLNLVSIHGMRESILDGMGTSLPELSPELRW
jgi:PHD/YefM family antitoxin component YafN of YafNO toxin-antitoxin module